MGDPGSTAPPAPAQRARPHQPPVPGDPGRAEMISTGEAAAIIGVDPRTVERWVDTRKIRGGRPRDPATGQVVRGSHRWVDARHAVAYAVSADAAHLVPPKWRHLIGRQQDVEPAAAPIGP